MTLSDPRYPKLRAVDARPFVQDGEVYILLRDPLQLTDKAITVPQQVGPLLALCDGTRDADALRAALMIRYGMRIAPDVLAGLLDALDEALLLESERFARARAQALDEYRRAAFRPPASAGRSYPADPDELRRLLQGYLDAAPDPAPSGAIRGLISPHIDYARGGPVYARVWKEAAEAARNADLVVFLGTDHSGRDGAITLTRQHYATPFGVLPTARDVVDALAAALDADALFAEELHHRAEHSVELAALWLHHVRGGEPCEILPVLCGSFGHFVRGEADAARDPTIAAFVDGLTQAVAGRRTLIVAAGDLSHVGPAFGGRPLDLVGRARLKAADDELIERVCAGDAEGFLAAVRRDGDRRNVCGLPPIYLALRLLMAAAGRAVAYDRCPADENGASLVSICGVILH